MTDTPVTFLRPSDSDGWGAGAPVPAISPTLGREVTCYADVKEIRRRWLGDTSLPPPQFRVPAAVRTWREEQARRDQLEAIRQRLTVTTELPWPECEAAWLESIRLAGAVLRGNDKEGAAA